MPPTTYKPVTAHGFRLVDWESRGLWHDIRTLWAGTSANANGRVVCAEIHRVRQPPVRIEAETEGALVKLLLERGEAV